MDLREMTFQNVLDTVLKPAGVKVGGFPEELFLDLSETEREGLSCGICYLVVNDCRQCDNKHLFCHTCIFAWSMTYGENSQKCPMCRCPQTEYLINKEITRSIENKRVQCLEADCGFRSPLKIFLMHSHGKAKYSNAHVDFERLRPQRSQILLLPFIQPNADGGSRVERAAGIRSQLQQGRLMIHQMMMLLHLEMQLRQQALSSYQAAQDPMLRIQRLDEVLALNEQLNEVGGILSGLLSTPLSRLGAEGNELGASLRRGLVQRPSLIIGLRERDTGSSREDAVARPSEGPRERTQPSSEAPTQPALSRPRENTTRLESSLQSVSSHTRETRRQAPAASEESSNLFSLNRPRETPRQVTQPADSSPSQPTLNRPRETPRQVTQPAVETSTQPAISRPRGTPRLHIESTTQSGLSLPHETPRQTTQPVESHHSSQLSVNSEQRSLLLPPISPRGSSVISQEPEAESTSSVLPRGSSSLHQAMQEVQNASTDSPDDDTGTFTVISHRPTAPNSRQRPTSRVESRAEVAPPTFENACEPRPPTNASRRPGRTSSQPRASRISVSNAPTSNFQRSSRQSTSLRRGSVSRETRRSSQGSNGPLLRARRRSEIQQQIRNGQRENQE